MNSLEENRQVLPATGEDVILLCPARLSSRPIEVGGFEHHTRYVPGVFTQSPLFELVEGGAG